MNRGSAIPDGRREILVACFNEAPIHESGKLAAGRYQAQNPKGFNEAPIHESGK